MPTKNMDELIAHINRNYPLKAYLYEVRIFGGDPSTDASQDVMLNCSAINVPGTNLQFNPFKKYGIGEMHQMPIGRSFTELNLTFYESDGEPEREFFAEWQNRIFNKETKRFGFYKDFVKTLSIIQYDKKRNKTYECQVRECFPSNVSPLDKGYSNEGIPQFNVNLQFYQVDEIFFDKSKGFNPFATLF